MQVIWCVKFSNMTKSGGDNPPLQILGGTCPPVIYAHDWEHAPWSLNMPLALRLQTIASQGNYNGLLELATNFT